MVGVRKIMYFLVVFLMVLTAIPAKVECVSTKDPYAREKDPTFWKGVSAAELKKALATRPILGRAKNVILFLGDGMGTTTVTAGRILQGQSLGKDGENHRLSFDNFPHIGLAVTYSVDRQTTDSAASGTAYTSGVKTNQGMLGLNAHAIRGNCKSAAGHEVDSILRWFLDAGKAGGVVTTTTVTHATPGSTYSHTVERNWEADFDMPPQAKVDGCKDIARQLVEDNPDINVVMGGGLNNFKPAGYNYSGPNPQNKYRRLDGKDLVEVWKKKKADEGKRFKYVTNRQELVSVKPSDVDYLLGLFAEKYMEYEVERDPLWEPSIAEMTEKAIKVLQNNDKGYFLMVEGGRIDHGHHASQPSRALHDVMSLSDAVAKAVQLTDEKDTLILVTADHSHTMSLAGYATRNHPILGKNDNDWQPPDLKPYTTIIYGTGPGYQAPRQNVSNVDTTAHNYTSQSAVPFAYEAHGGEDVTMYARGPQAHLYSGVHENTYIPTLMAYASCVGPYSNEKDCAPKDQSFHGAGSTLQASHSVLFLLMSLVTAAYAAFH